MTRITRCACSRPEREPVGLRYEGRHLARCDRREARRTASRDIIFKAESDRPSKGRLGFAGSKPWGVLTLPETVHSHVFAQNTDLGPPCGDGSWGIYRTDVWIELNADGTGPKAP
jgi:hypothetical protein